MPLLRSLVALCLGSLLASGLHAAAPSALVPGTEVETAARLIREHRFGEAVNEHLNPVIAEFEKTYADPEVQVYCSGSAEETLFYMVYFTSHGRKGCKQAIAVGAAYATAYFLKGYILVDQRNLEKATAYVEKAVELSPYNSNFLNELAHLHQVRKDWDKALTVFDQAIEGAKAFSKQGDTANLRRALRGKAYVFVELKRFEEAEALYNECLTLDPKDDRAKGELQYVGQLRAAKK